MIQQLFVVIAPVFLIAGIGYLWARTRQPFDTLTIANLVAMIATPCLVFSSLSTLETGLGALTEIIVAAIIYIAAMAAIAWGFLRLLGWDVNAFTSALSVPNAGNLGMPISLFAFGETGLALAVAVSTVCTGAHFTLGVAMFSGKASWTSIARTPSFVALGAAFAVLGFDLTVPGWLLDTTRILGGAMIPLMLLSLGVSLARMRIDRLGRTVTLSLFRILVGGIMAVVVARMLGLDPLMTNILVIQGAMPVAVFSYLLSAKYDRRPAEVASLVMGSTLIAMVTIPLLLSFLLSPSAVWLYSN